MRKIDLVEFIARPDQASGLNETFRKWGVSKPTSAGGSTASSDSQRCSGDRSPFTSSLPSEESEHVGGDLAFLRLAHTGPIGPQPGKCDQRPRDSDNSRDAFPNDVDRTRALTDGVVCCLRKPVNEEHLTQCICAALRSGDPPEADS